MYAPMCTCKIHSAIKGVRKAKTLPIFLYGPITANTQSTFHPLASFTTIMEKNKECLHVKTHPQRTYGSIAHRLH